MAKVVCNEHTAHARCGFGLAHIDRVDVGFWEWAPHEGDVGHSGEHHVADITSLTAQQSWIFFPTSASTNKASRFGIVDVGHVRPPS